MDNTATSNLWDERSKESIVDDALSQLSKLECNGSDAPEAISDCKSPPILYVRNRRLDGEFKPTTALEYLKSTEECRTQPGDCMKDEAKPMLRSLYVRFNDRDSSALRSALVALRESADLSIRRAVLIEALMQAWSRRPLELDGPNDDSKTGGDLIEGFFNSAGMLDPVKYIGNKRDEWAWCSAFAASMLGRAGIAVNFNTAEQHAQACAKVRGQGGYCNPTQVLYWMEWAKLNSLLMPATDEAWDAVMPGDMLTLSSKQDGLANHIGFYLAKEENCSMGGFAGVCIYTIEGNSGPFLNDKLEKFWPQVLELVSTGKITREGYLNLLDGVNLVKRPADSWDNVISLPK